MSKEQLIKAIQQRNRSATTMYLEQFPFGELIQYLAQLMTLPGEGARGATDLPRSSA